MAILELQDTYFQLLDNASLFDVILIQFSFKILVLVNNEMKNIKKNHQYISSTQVTSNFGIVGLTGRLWIVISFSSISSIVFQYLLD